MRHSGLLLLLVATSASAQAPPGAPAVVSPQVLYDNRVTFRFRAPNAKEVLLAREGAKRVPMEKSDQGVWSITTAPLEPDYYGYSFIVDGVALIDPANPLMKASLLNTENMV